MTGAKTDSYQSNADEFEEMRSHPGFTEQMLRRRKNLHIVLGSKVMINPLISEVLSPYDLTLSTCGTSALCLSSHDFPLIHLLGNMMELLLAFLQ